MRRSASRSTGIAKVKSSVNRQIEWELRPSGLLVQKSDTVVKDNADYCSLIKIKVSHGSYQHDITVPAQPLLVKRVLAHEIGLEPKEQRLLFKGKEKDDEEQLHIAGVKDMSKVVMLEDSASKERKLEEVKRNQDILKACEEVAKVTAQVDKLAEKVISLERVLCGGAKVAEKEFVVLTELFMMQLLKLDAIEVDEEAKVKRRIEVRRVQSFVDTVDNLKARNANPFSNNVIVATVNTKWETFESGVGSLAAPSPLQSSTKITQDWEQFD